MSCFARQDTSLHGTVCHPSLWAERFSLWIDYTFCRSAWWPKSFRRGRLTVVLLLLLCLHGPAGTAAKQCTRFRPSGCHFTTRHNEPVLYPVCKSACHFEVRGRIVVDKTGSRRAASSMGIIQATQLLVITIT